MMISGIYSVFKAVTQPERSSKREQTILWYRDNFQEVDKFFIFVPQKALL